MHKFLHQDLVCLDAQKGHIIAAWLLQCLIMNITNGETRWRMQFIVYNSLPKLASYHMFFSPKPCVLCRHYSAILTNFMYIPHFISLVMVRYIYKLNIQSLFSFIIFILCSKDKTVHQYHWIPRNRYGIGMERNGVSSCLFVVIGHP